MTFQVGDRVRARVAVFEPANDCHPAGYLCSKGDELVVRKLPQPHVNQAAYPCAVSHENVTDCSFWVLADEIEALQ